MLYVPGTFRFLYASTLALCCLWHCVFMFDAKLLLMLAAAVFVNNVAKLCLQVMLSPQAHHLALFSAKHAL